MIEILEARIAPALILNGAGQLSNDQFSKNLVATDAQGNIFIAGRFSGTLVLPHKGALIPDGGSVSTSDQSGDLFVVKLTPDLDFVWATKWGGTGGEEATDLLVDGNGDVYVTGSFGSANAGFGGSGPLQAPTGQSQTFLFKVHGEEGDADLTFSSDGQLIFGNNNNSNAGKSLALDNSGSSIFLAGDFSGLGNGVNGSGFLDAIGGRSGYVVNLDASTGAVNFNFGGSNGGLVITNNEFDDSIFRIRLSSNGDLYVGLDSFSTEPFTDTFTIQKLVGDNGFQRSGVFAGDGSLVIGINADVDFLLDANDGNRIVTAIADGSSLSVSRYDDQGNADIFFGAGESGTITLSNLAAGSVSVLRDASGLLYFAGETATNKNYLTRLTDGGQLDSSFAKNGIALFGGTPSAFAGKNKVGVAMDGSGNIVFQDHYSGQPDLDPGTPVKKLAAASPARGANAEGFVLSFDPNGSAAGQSLTFPGSFDDGGGQQATIIVTLTGPGRVHVTPSGSQGNMESIELFDTTLASKLTVVVKNPGSSQRIDRIFTHDPLQHMGSIIIDPIFNLGNGAPDSIPDLLISGKINNIVLGDINQNAIIRLGQDLPYNAPGSTIPDTYNNKPNLRAGNIFGAGVLIDVTGDGVTARGVGGGGFGKVVIERWDYDGLLRTTQSIGSFTIKQGNFSARLEVDPNHLGEGTTADVGSMTVENGSWGSSGTVIEGNVGSFNAEAFLAAAAITAGNIGTINTGEGGFNGTLTLTDDQARGVASLTVNSDFTGKIESLAPLKRLNIKGNFMGSLTAPSIASITAFSFLGGTAGDTVGDPARFNITTTFGLLGVLRATAGVIENFELESAGNFSGMTIVLGKLDHSVTGIKNVSVLADNIGATTVVLGAKTTAAAVDLTGIMDLTYSTDGKIGNTVVKISGASGASFGVDNLQYTGGSIGNFLVTASKGIAPGATAQAVDDAELVSGSTIGAVNILGNATATQAVNLDLVAGGRIAAVNIKATTASFASLQSGSILAGQNLNLAALTTNQTLAAGLAAASLGPVNIAGSMLASTIAAGGTVASVLVGGEMSQSFVLGGALLGADRAVGGANDTYHLGGNIGAVTVKGFFDRNSISAGVKTTDATFGNGDDTVADAIGTFTLVAAIKSVNLSSATVSELPPILAHSHAIQANKIGKVTVAGVATTDFSAPFFLDAGGGEDTNDVLVQVKPLV